MTTNASGGLVSQMRFTPFGEELTWSESEDASPTDFGYTGQRNERGFGLMDYNARFYAPSLGRFISADTIVPDAGNPIYDRFAYVFNNPLNRIDPSGHSAGCGPFHSCPDDPAPPIPRPDPWGGVPPWEEVDIDMEIWLKQNNTSLEQMFISAMRSPLHGDYRTTTLFGNPNTLGGPGYHPGVDIDYHQGDNDRGESVFSTAYGVVVQIRTSDVADFGLTVIVEHNVYGEKYYSIYAHLDSITVEVGDVVDNTTQLGTLGDTPIDLLDNPVHLHFEVRKPGGVNTDSTGNYVSLPLNADSFWIDSEAELDSKWLDISPIFGGYPTGYPPCSWTSSCP